MTTTDKAATIRQALKVQHGWNRNHVSVRRDGCSIEVTIKDASVKEQAVRKIANEQRSVRYDEATQCILRGGNTFVHVKWDSAVLDTIAARLPLDNVQKPAEGATGSPTLSVGRLDIWRSNDHMDTWSWNVRREDGQSWEDHHAFTSNLRDELRDGGADPFRCWSREDCGRNIARAILHLGIDLDAEPAPDSVANTAAAEPAQAPAKVLPFRDPGLSPDDSPPTPSKRTVPVTSTQQGGRYRQGQDVAAIAKLIRRDIKTADLPKGLKASVRISRYSQGKTISITVTCCPVVVLNPERVKDDAAQKCADGRPWRSAPGQAIVDILQAIGERYQKSQTTDQPDDRPARRLELVQLSPVGRLRSRRDQRAAGWDLGALLRGPGSPDHPQGLAAAGRVIGSHHDDFNREHGKDGGRSGVRSRPRPAEATQGRRPQDLESAPIGRPVNP